MSAFEIHLNKSLHTAVFCGDRLGLSGYHALLTRAKVSRLVSLTLGHGSLSFELMIHQLAGPFFFFSL